MTGKGEGVLYNPKYGNYLIYLEHQMPVRYHPKE